MGCWVLAHECGHNAFHPNRRIEGVVGFLLHSALLVPYYSWARSHSVHHAHCNHLEQGETHVPPGYIAAGPNHRTTQKDAAPNTVWGYFPVQSFGDRLAALFVSRSHWRRRLRFPHLPCLKRQTLFQRQATPVPAIISPIDGAFKPRPTGDDRLADHRRHANLTAACAGRVWIAIPGD
ncbi:MAG: fatty acid desaturase [Synechococcus sp.]